jgi:hypothetical protein
MKRFKTILNEAKLTHLEHLEDAIFDDGYAGGVEALKILTDISNTLAGHSKKPINIQAKVDGAPSIVAGINPENGKFFVGTKAVFNRTPKLNYTNADVDKHHEGNLAVKLKIALKEFPKMGIKGIIQGDFMFIPSDLKKETIDDEKYVTFTPNTITYAVPAGTDLAKKITKAKVGVVWHTTYSGDTIADLSAQFNINISKLKKTNDVWYTDTNFSDVSGTATLTVSEMAFIQKRLASAQKELSLLDKKSLEVMFGKTEIAFNMKIYINDLTKQGKKFSGRQQAVGGFIEFLRKRYNPMIAKLKTEKGRAKKESSLKDLINIINKNRKIGGTLAYALQWHDDVADIKLLLVKKMEKVNKIPAFIKTPTGYKTTGPEGFVAIDVLSNSAVKLVNRLEFSRNNFNAIKNWG